MAQLADHRERRHSGRIAASKGVLAFNGKKYGRIIDASMGGLCFQYLSRRKRASGGDTRKCKSLSSLDIVFGKYNFTLIGLPVKAAADYQVLAGQEGEPAVNVRRRAVTFEKLSPRQLFQLKRFLLLNRYGDQSSCRFEDMRKESGEIVSYAAK